MARALSRLGQGDYHLIFNNCQHFARWCATGDHESEQVRSAAATSGTIITPLAATALTSTVIAPAGMVTGLSGPGIMSGLAAYGAIVAGLVVLGSVPALASVAIMHHALHPDDDLPGPERTARTAGRAGAVAGAVIGSAGGVAAVSALGVPGLGAAGISSGLAAIGAAATGGGMAIGAACVIAAPAAIAAILGYLVYRIALWLTSGEPAATTNTGPAPATG